MKKVKEKKRKERTKTDVLRRNGTSINAWSQSWEGKEAYGGKEFCKRWAMLQHGSDRLEKLWIMPVVNRWKKQFL